jgi:hypothetical protein
MTIDGGGWTLVRKEKFDTLVSGNTTSNNVASLANLTTDSANLADTVFNVINPTQVWNICNGYQTIYTRNVSTPWTSAQGQVNSCSYNANFWTGIQKDF